MNETDLAKQLNSYADAIAAFSFGQSVLFFYAIGRADSFTRDLLKWPQATALGTALMTSVYFLAVVRCHTNERRLNKPTNKGGIEADISNEIRNWRLGIIILTGIMCCVGAFWGHSHPPIYDSR
jgi:hypothetical protein